MRKKLVYLLSSIFPGFFTNVAYRQLTNPQVRKLRDHELAILQTAAQEDYFFKGFTIKTYKWEGGDDSILLIHGWEGQAGNFADLIQQLHAHNYTIYAFDGPAHGFSSKGQTTLFEFTDLVAELIRYFGTKKLVTHSFGAVATTLALSHNQDIEIDKYVLFTPPDSFLERIDYVADQVGISDDVKHRLIDRLEAEANIDVSAQNVRDFVKHANVKEALIFHGVNDKVIPIQQARRVHQNLPQSTMKEIDDTGHFRILRTDWVLDDVIAFLKS